MLDVLELVLDVDVELDEVLDVLVLDEELDVLEVEELVDEVLEELVELVLELDDVDDVEVEVDVEVPTVGKPQYCDPSCTFRDESFVS